MLVGSDETISLIFSQPNVHIYAITYNSCQDGFGSMRTSTTYVKRTKNTKYAACKIKYI